MYMNDLSSCAFKGKLVMYADDAVLAYACDDPNELWLSMIANLMILDKWLSINVLNLNVYKTNDICASKEN